MRLKNMYGSYNALKATFISCLWTFFGLAGMPSVEAQDYLSFVSLTPSNVRLHGPSAEVVQELQSLWQLPDSPNSCTSMLKDCSEKSVCSLEVSSCLPDRYQAASGKKFLLSGPNCFSTALHLTGQYSGFRGVNGDEFDSYVSLACRSVDSSVPGSIGIYEAKNFGSIHAFVPITRQFVMDKPGVDQLGFKTEVRIRHFESVRRSHGASAECYQYAPDPSVCSNELKYVVCEPLSFSYHFLANQHQKLAQKLEQKINSLLLRDQITNVEQELWQQILTLFSSLEKDLEIVRASSGVLPEHKDYFQKRVKSFEYQIRYIQPQVR